MRATGARHGRDKGASRATVVSIGLLLLALLLGGCGDLSGGQDSGQGLGSAGDPSMQDEPLGTPPPARGTAVPGNAAAQLPPDADRRAPRDPHYYEVINIAVGGEGKGAAGDIEAFWRQEFPKLGTNVAYQSPRGRFHYYPEPGETPPTVCVPRNANPRSLANNAFYCPEDQTISWDENFLWSQYKTYGDMAPVVILAHEWGHHIQRLAGYPAFSVQAELQADCYAGLYTKGAETKGYLEEGDVDEATYSLYDAGNPMFDDALWFAPNEHGSPEERASAYYAGYSTGDPARCLAYKKYHPGEIVEVGPYQLALAPGTRYQRLEDGTYRLQSRLGNALIRSIPDLPPQPPASEQLAQRSGEWLGEGARSLGGPYEIQVNPNEGKDSIQRYEQTIRARDGSEQPVHGFLFLHVDPQGGGYIVDTYALGPAPSDEAGWEPVTQQLRILLAGLKRGE